MSNTPLYFGSWNMRGLNDPIKQIEIKSFVKNNNMSLIGLIEHKIKEPNSGRILNSMLPNWSFVHNYAHAPIGRNFVSWNPDLGTLNVLGQSSQAIHYQVQSVVGDIQFIATFVYGSNKYLERVDLWHDLSLWNSTNPWVILGYFNALRFPFDKVGGDRHWPSYMGTFNNCITSNELYDLRYSGCHFTWANKQDPNHFVSTKIDRVLINE